MRGCERSSGRQGGLSFLDFLIVVALVVLVLEVILGPMIDQAETCRAERERVLAVLDHCVAGLSVFSDRDSVLHCLNEAQVAVSSLVASGCLGRARPVVQAAIDRVNAAIEQAAQGQPAPVAEELQASRLSLPR